jgi:hypothetical protein
MKYAVEMRLSCHDIYIYIYIYIPIYISSFIKTGSGIQKLREGIHKTHRQHGDRISLSFILVHLVVDLRPTSVLTDRSMVDLVVCRPYIY